MHKFELGFKMFVLALLSNFCQFLVSHASYKLCLFDKHARLLMKLSPINFFFYLCLQAGRISKLCRNCCFLSSYIEFILVSSVVCTHIWSSNFKCLCLLCDEICLLSPVSCPCFFKTLIAKLARVLPPIEPGRISNWGWWFILNLGGSAMHL